MSDSDAPIWTNSSEGGITQSNGKYWIFEKGKWRHLPYHELQDLFKRRIDNEAYERAKEVF